MISSRVREESGGSMTTSQCSKSHPSSRIVSLGGRLLQFGDGSLSEDVVGRVEKHLVPEASANELRRSSGYSVAAARRGRKRSRGEGQARGSERAREERQRVWSLAIRIRRVIAKRAWGKTLKISAANGMGGRRVQTSKGFKWTVATCYAHEFVTSFPTGLQPSKCDMFCQRN